MFDIGSRSAEITKTIRSIFGGRGESKRDESAGINGHDRFVKRSRGGGGKSDCAGGSRQFYRIERVTGPPLSRPYRQIQELCARTSPSADDVRPLYFIIRHCVANPNKRTAKVICLWMETSPNVIRIYLERRRRSTLFNVLLRGFFSTPYLWTESGERSERESRVLEYPRTSAANRTERRRNLANRGKINNVDSCKYSVYICMYIRIYLIFARNYNNIKFNKERIVLLY